MSAKLNKAIKKWGRVGTRVAGKKGGKSNSDGLQWKGSNLK